MKQCNGFCVQTFNYPIKACFSNKNYLNTIQIRTSKIINSIFIIEKLVLIEFSKVIVVQSVLVQF